MSFGPIEGDVPLEQMDWDSYLTEDGAPYLNFDPSSLNFKNPNGVEAVTGSV